MTNVSLLDLAVYSATSFVLARELQEASAFSVVSTRLNFKLLWKEDLFRLLSPTNERALVELRQTRLVLVLIFSTGIQS